MPKQQDSTPQINPGLPNPETSEKLASMVLDHYLKHHQIVLGKLTHAREATSQSIEDIEDICARFEMDKNAQEFQTVIQFDAVWDSIIDMFRSSGITEGELEQIEKILQTIPNAIRKYYEALLLQDKILQSMMREIESDDYKNAIAATQKIQSQVNLMSGLEADVYDLSDLQDNSESGDVMIYKPMPGKSQRH